MKTQKELKAEEQRKLVQEQKLKKDRTKGSIVVASYDLWDSQWLVSLEFVAKKIFVLYAQINISVVNLANIYVPPPLTSTIKSLG